MNPDSHDLIQRHMAVLLTEDEAAVLQTRLKADTDRPAAELGHSQSSTDGSLDVQLITSIDGRKWQRAEKREAIIPRGAATAPG